MENHKPKPSISVILPVYNEVKLLPSAVQAIDDFLNQHFPVYEILMIESGSTDGTDTKCDELAGAYAAVRVIHEGGRNGFGSALKLGYQYAKLDYCWLITVDIPFPLEAVLEAEKYLSQYDFVISYRSEDKRAWTRRVQSWVYNAMVRCWFGLRVKCVNSAFKLLPTAVMRDMSLVSNYWFIDAEILYRLSKAGLTYTEIPVPLIDRTEGASSVTSNAFVKMLKEMHDFSKIRRTIPDCRKARRAKADMVDNVNE